MSDNWVVQMLTNILNTWNSKLSEIWSLITQSPQEFKSGAVWGIIVNIHHGLMAIGLALLVLFFVVGVMKTCGSFSELKKPEHAVKLFIRFILAKAVVTYGMELMLSLLSIIQGIISTVLNSAGFGEAQQVALPEELIKTIEKCGFFESIPLWIVALIGVLFVWILSLVLILTDSHCTDSAVIVCRRADSGYWKELPEKLCRSMSARRYYCIGLYYLFRLCRIPACGKSGTGTGDSGLDLYRRAVI